MFQSADQDPIIGCHDHKLEKRLVATIAADTSGKTYRTTRKFLLEGEVFADSDARAAYSQITSAIQKKAQMPEVKGRTTKTPIASAKKLHTLFQKRIVREVGDEAYQCINNGNFDATEVATKLDARLATLASISPSTSKRNKATVLADQLAKIERIYAARKDDPWATVGLPTPFRRLNELTGGLQPGMHILAGEPACGKTTLALKIATYLAIKKFPVLFVSFEEPEERLLMRAICSNAKRKIIFKHAVEGYVKPKKIREAIDEVSPKLKSLEILSGNPKLTVAEIKRRACALMRSANSKQCLVIVDYLQRWAMAGESSGDVRHIVSRLTFELRDVFATIGIPVIAISSINRTSYRQGAQLGSLKESGEIEYTADNVMIAIADKDTESHKRQRDVELHLVKNRFGDERTVSLVFDPQYGTFKEKPW